MNYHFWKNNSITYRTKFDSWWHCVSKRRPGSFLSKQSPIILVLFIFLTNSSSIKKWLSSKNDIPISLKSILIKIWFNRWLCFHWPVLKYYRANVFMITNSLCPCKCFICGQLRLRCDIMHVELRWLFRSVFDPKITIENITIHVLSAA